MKKEINVAVFLLNANVCNEYNLSKYSKAIVKICK